MVVRKMSCSTYRQCCILALVFFIVFLFASPLHAQNGEISGTIRDSSDAVIPNAKLKLANEEAAFTRTTDSNTSGVYSFPSVPPGVYDISVATEGFQSQSRKGVTLNAASSVQFDFVLNVGNVQSEVTVAESGQTINAADASVGTVVDRQFVENLPLNGRSFQSLITLTPGVVLTTATESNPGQFSVNGQRPDANYFTVDGVGANLGIIPDTVLNQVGGGPVPATTASGGLNNLVSIDALQEFRVMTSTYAPEYGRTPGGQIQLVTRSGTNAFHGTVFDYFRNSVLDANNWFANQNHLAKPAERQNDFGGVFGGPLLKDRSFFFFSYEGLRLVQPVTATSMVPSLAVRWQAIPAMQPFLNAFPLPSGPDLTGGFSRFSASYSNPTDLDATSIRIDQNAGSKLRVFGRFNHAPSTAKTRAPFGGSLNQVTTNPFLTQTLTGGGTYTITPRMVNEFRVNWSRSTASNSQTLDNLGGAVPVLDDSWFPAAYQNVKNVNFTFGVGSVFVQRSNGTTTDNAQRQLNIIDNHSFTAGAHQLKFGIDYRRLMPIYQPLPFNGLASFTDAVSAETGLIGLGAIITFAGSRYPTFNNLSLYGQDTFRITPRFTATYGMRWELNPAPREAHGNDPVAVTGLENPATLALAPKVTPQWSTTYANVAPRLGLAYTLSDKPGAETVVRGGFGVFYDLGSGYNFNAFSSSWPSASYLFLPAGTPFPYSSSIQPPPISTALPAGALYVSVPNLKLPRTYQWNISIERSVGRDQTATATYVGAAGRDLLWMDFLSNPNPNFTTLNITTNLGKSDYEALQLQFHRRLSRGLQLLLSYAWSHSLDNGSDDSQTHVIAPNINPDRERGPSDFDIRHVSSGAVTYNIASPASSGAAAALTRDWAVDLVVAARSAVPVNVLATTAPLFGVTSALRPNLQPNVPLYIDDSTAPGGKRLNRAAFTAAPAGQQGNLGRNALRGFGLNQFDFTLRRQFSVTERLKLQARAEFFNIFNHPNFGPPDKILTDGLFGVATGTFGTSLGPGGFRGGFSSLYQAGGPRSGQLALKLMF